MKTLIALGADVNQRNEYNMTSLDVVKFTQQSDPNMMQLLKDVGGVAGQAGLPQQETFGAQTMDTGEETMSQPGMIFLLLPLLSLLPSPTSGKSLKSVREARCRS